MAVSNNSNVQSIKIRTPSSEFASLLNVKGFIESAILEDLQTLVINVILVNKEYSCKYSYIGTLELLLNSNNINKPVNIQYFTNELGKANKLDIDENIIIINFSLELNFIEYFVKVVCTRIYDNELYNNDDVSKKLHAKTIEMSNLVDDLKEQVNMLKKIVQNLLTIK
jgi:hypothetical protein